MIQKNTSERGLIRTVILIVIALIILGYFGFNLRTILNSPTVQDNLNYAGEIALNIWNQYLKGIATVIWNFISTKLLSSYPWSTLTNGQALH